VIYARQVVVMQDTISQLTVVQSCYSIHHAVCCKYSLKQWSAVASQAAYGQSFVTLLAARYCIGTETFIFLDLLVTCYAPAAG
jgi:hypothetical protein